MTCPIWNAQPLEEKPHTGDSRTINSPRAGGWYSISGTAEALIKNASVAERLAITRWLVAQRAAGTAIPHLTSDNLDFAKSTRKRIFTERLNALLLTISRGMQTLDTISRIGGDDAYTLNLVAQTDSQSIDELRALASIAKSERFLADRGVTMEYANYTLTATAWERIEALESVSPKGEQAFVAMWFDASMGDVYATGFIPAIERSGYRPMRIDGKDHINKVDDEIIAEIRRSRFLVSDFTCAPRNVRGGVYFEAGFAMGLGLPVIWTVRSDSIPDLHFDTRQYNHVVWEKPDDLSRQLEQRIRAVLGTGPLVPV